MPKSSRRMLLNRIREVTQPNPEDLGIIKVMVFTDHDEVNYAGFHRPYAYMTTSWELPVLLRELLENYRDMTLVTVSTLTALSQVPWTGAKLAYTKISWSEPQVLWQKEGVVLPEYWNWDRVYT